jgi:hypothetical protein
MKAIILAAAVLAFSGVLYMNRSAELSSYDEVDTSKDFFDYMIAFGKQYVDKSEFSLRYQNFRKSVVAISTHNANRNRTSTLGHNQFSDWT